MTAIELIFTKLKLPQQLL